MLAVAAGKPDPTGEKRRRAQDQGKALASSSTLNRLELTPAHANRDARYKKIVADQAGLDRLLVAQFIASHDAPPATLWLDLDATDAQLDFPVFCTDARKGLCRRGIEGELGDLRPLLDQILEAYIERQLPPGKIAELGFDPILIRRIIAMVNQNEYKRYQTPPILRISSKAFGVGRRLPLVAIY